MKRYTKYREWLVAMLLPMLMSCQKEDIQTSGYTDERLIAFATTIEGQWADTRASVLTAGNLQDFGVSASYYTSGSYAGAACGGYFFRQKVLTSERYCGREWAGAAYTLSFFGYAPYSNLIGIQSAEALGRPVYTYTVPSSIALQIDLMTAETLEVTGGNKTTPVPLAFSHRLSDLRFDIYNEGPQTMTVHNIALYGLKYSGTLDGDIWTPTGSANSSSVNPFKLDLADPANPDDGVAITSGSTSAELTGTANHFMMIPQTVTSGTSIFFVDATVKGKRAVFHYTLDANLTLQAGKTYHVTLTMGYDDIRIKTLSVTDWTEDPASVGTTPPNQRISGRVGSNSQVNDWEENPSQEETTTANRRVGGNVGSGTGISDWTFGTDNTGGVYGRTLAEGPQLSINSWSGTDIPKAGDIVLYNSGNFMAIPYREWNTSSYPTDTYVPIGVVLVPRNHTSDKTTRVIALKNMSASDPENGSLAHGDVTDIQLYWGGPEYNIETLNDFTDAPITNPHSSYNNIEETYNDGDDGENYIYNSYIPINYTEYSEFENGLESFTDPGSKYYNIALIDNPEEYAPSVYMPDGRRNPLIDGNRSRNLFTDTDGYSNTQKILAVDNAVSTAWQTASSIDNVNNSPSTHPAAQTCWRYATVGVAPHMWYLPSIGELAYLASRYKDINAALIKIMDADPTLAVRMFNEAFDGSWNDTNYGSWFLSSTERSTTHYYDIMPQSGLISMHTTKGGEYHIYDHYRVRAVTKLNL